MALVFGGLVRMLGGIADIRYHEQLGATALRMYVFFWPLGNGKVVWRNLNSNEPVSRA